MAVVPVILYHAKVPGLPGGFVGVDIFFVISGYLITSLIVADIKASRFTLTDFYERRLRRIVPALITVVACSLIAGYFLMTPQDYHRGMRRGQLQIRRSQKDPPLARFIDFAIGQAA